ncbi:hypothetical protein [Halococcus saccharolyticus]|uniref:hypothetical protein n=1 Tax=Halococcus saccharolyticus TaxID=62319 RepID=UPI000B2E01C5|nr:hypothetical protein [Halococcus saccharolyticus]
MPSIPETILCDPLQTGRVHEADVVGRDTDPGRSDSPFHYLIVEIDGSTYRVDPTDS